MDFPMFSQSDQVTVPSVARTKSRAEAKAAMGWCRCLGERRDKNGVIKTAHKWVCLKMLG